MMDAKCCVYPNVTTTMAAAAKKSSRFEKVSCISRKQGIGRPARRRGRVCRRRSTK